MNRDAINPTIAEAVGFCVANYRRLIMLGFLPGAVYLALAVVIESTLGGDGTSRSLGVSIAYSILTIGVELVLVPFYVAWHRLTLIGDSGVSGQMLPLMGARDALYAGYLCLLFLIFLPAEILVEISASSPEAEESLLAVLGPILSVANPVVLIWVSIRLSFLFVDTAVDGRATIREAWKLTRGNTYVLTFITLPVSAAIFLVCFGLVALVIIPILSISDYGGSWMDVVYVVTIAPAIVIAGAYWVSATSIAYRDATGWTPDQPLATQADA